MSGHQHQQQHLLQNQPINLTKISDSHRILINDSSASPGEPENAARSTHQYTGVLTGDDHSGIHTISSSSTSTIVPISSSAPSTFPSSAVPIVPSGSVIRQPPIPAAATAVRLSTVPLSVNHPLHHHHQHPVGYQPLVASTRMLFPPTSVSAAAAGGIHSPVIRGSGGGSGGVAQSGAVVKALARCGRLASVTVASAAISTSTRTLTASGATVVAAARAPGAHGPIARAGASHARLCSVSTGGGVVHAPRFSAARPVHVTGVLAAPGGTVARPIGGGGGNYRSLMAFTTTTTTPSLLPSTPGVGGGGMMLTSRATITAVTAAPAAMAVSVTTAGGALIPQQHQPIAIDKSAVLAGSMTAKAGGGGAARVWQGVVNSGPVVPVQQSSTAAHSVSSTATILPIAKVVPQHPPALMVDSNLRDFSVANNRNTGYAGSGPAMILARPAVAFTYPPAGHLPSVVTTTAASNAATSVSPVTGNSTVVQPSESQQQQQLQQRIPTTLDNDSSITEPAAMAATQRLSLMLENRLAAGSNSQHQHQPTRVTTSPRPCILRKREPELCGSRSSRDLSRQLLDATAAASPVVASPSLQLIPQQHQQPNTRQRCLSSGHSSSTVSASSSPGQSSPPAEELPTSSSAPTDHPLPQQQQPPGSVTPSPRRKPRKQNFGSASSASMVLTFPSTSALVEPKLTLTTPLAPSGGTEPKVDWTTGLDQHMQPAADAIDTETAARTVFRRPVMSLLQTAGGKEGSSWRATSSHFERYQDVRVKDDRRPNIVDLASQRRITQKVNGWRIHQLSDHTDQLIQAEKLIHRQLAELLRSCEKLNLSRREDKELAKLVELIKSNIQRSKITSDQLSEASVQLSAVLQHKPTVLNVIERYARKRSTRKRERT